jgi:hypothetical protein
MYSSPNWNNPQAQNNSLGYMNAWTGAQVNAAQNNLAATNNTGSGDQAQAESQLEAAQARQAIYGGMNSNTAQDVNFAGNHGGFGGVRATIGGPIGGNPFGGPTAYSRMMGGGNGLTTVSPQSFAGMGSGGGMSSGGGGGGGGPQSQSAPSTETAGPPVTLNNPQGYTSGGNAGNSVTNYGGAASSYSPANARVNPAQIDELGGEIVGQSPSSYQQGPLTNIPWGMPGTYGQPDSGSYASYSGTPGVSSPFGIFGGANQSSFNPTDYPNSMMQGQMDALSGYGPTYGPPSSLNSNTNNEINQTIGGIDGQGGFGGAFDGGGDD